MNSDLENDLTSESTQKSQGLNVGFLEDKIEETNNSRSQLSCFLEASSTTLSTSDSDSDYDDWFNSTGQPELCARFMNNSTTDISNEAQREESAGTLNNISELIEPPETSDSSHKLAKAEEIIQVYLNGRRLPPPFSPTQNIYRPLPLPIKSATRVSNRAISSKLELPRRRINLNLSGQQSFNFDNNFRQQNNKVETVSNIEPLNSGRRNLLADEREQSSNNNNNYANNPGERHLLVDEIDEMANRPIFEQELNTIPTTNNYGRLTETHHPNFVGVDNQIEENEIGHIFGAYLRINRPQTPINNVDEETSDRNSVPADANTLPQNRIEVDRTPPNEFWSIPLQVPTLSDRTTPSATDISDREAGVANRLQDIIRNSASTSERNNLENATLNDPDDIATARETSLEQNDTSLMNETNNQLTLFGEPRDYFGFGRFCSWI